MAIDIVEMMNQLSLTILGIEGKTKKTGQQKLRKTEKLKKINLNPLLYRVVSLETIFPFILKTIENK